MFPSRYFPSRYFAARYWAKVGGIQIISLGYHKGVISTQIANSGIMSVTQAVNGKMKVFKSVEIE